jgi:hypothetical protein
MVALEDHVAEPLQMRGGKPLSGGAEHGARVGGAVAGVGAGGVGHRGGRRSLITCQTVGEIV